MGEDPQDNVHTLFHNDFTPKHCLAIQTTSIDVCNIVINVCNNVTSDNYLKNEMNSVLKQEKVYQ